MNKAIEWRDKIVALITSVVTVSFIVSQAGAEVAEVIGGWDGNWVNAVAVGLAIINIVRRVTPVAKEERGLT